MRLHHFEKFWTRAESDLYHYVGDIVYVGITELSVEVHTSQGQRYRITNEEFSKGLVIEAERIHEVAS